MVPATEVSPRDPNLARYRGALLGLAAGDALGTTLEFSIPGRFDPIDDMVGGGPFRLAPGQWTDDTSMALCLAESILEAGWDPVDQLRRYVRWMKEGHLSSTGRCFDMGRTVLSALGRFERTGEPYCGSTHPNSAGNGSIMRLAPVALRFAHDRDEAIARAAESSRTTHAAATAVDACRYLAALIVGALEGLSKGELVEPDYFTPETLEIRAVAAGSFRVKEPPEIRGSGYVVESLEAALWAFHRSSSFEEGALLAVNLGSDADTTGAVFGQLAGAHYGEAGIPQRWRQRLALRETIESFADRLFDATSGGKAGEDVLTS
jgi:ADP-ribosyl-[dinitrogen reductase] hydrolase